MERQIITVDIAPGNSQVERLGSSQGDIGRPMGVYIIQNGVALDCSAYSAELYILKPDGKFYTTQATVDATEKNLIKWETALQETPVAGACAAQIRITAGVDDIGTARFVEFVEASPGDMGAASESEVALLTEYVRQARESATSAGRDATTASGAASSASGSASTATTAANTATQAASAATAAADRAEAVEESIPADYSQMSADVTELKSVFEQLNDNVITESAGPAPIVSIEDGADGMPIRSVEVAIEPVQDLHGYEYPWPAGGGKNLLKVTASTNTVNGVTFTINEDGTISCSGNATDTIIFNVCRWTGTSGTEYILNGCPSGGSGSKYKLDYNNSPYVIDNGSGVSFSASGNEGMVRIVIYAGYGNGLVFKPMIRLATETDATFAPYSNVCPISGWTGAKVTRTGKNLLDVEKCRSGTITVVDGVMTGTSTNFSRNFNNENSLFAFDQDAGRVVLSFDAKTDANAGETGQGLSFIINYTDGSRTRINIPNSTTTYTRFTLASEANKIVSRINITYSSIGSNIWYLKDLQIELGSTATAYEPYQGQTYEVTFPADPGTVYGGTLDVASGELVVDMAMITFDGTQNGLGISRGSTANRIAWNIYEAVGAARTDFTSDTLASSSRATSVKSEPWLIYNTNSATAPRMFMTVPTTIASVEDFNAYVAQHPISVVYYLATPQEITLSTTEIKTLLGMNNVWADAGNTSITYPADTKMYIDNRINSTRRLIAGIETGFVASKLYAVGDMLIIGDDLYKVTAQIASGATITVGTNVTKTTVAEQLLALANA